MPLDEPYRGSFRNNSGWTNGHASQNDQGEARQGADIPLSLLALIISYVDDVGDLARLTRASRILYYMTVPRLYDKVTLRAYSEIRYKDGRPEGFGGGSPFSAALAGMLTRGQTPLIREIRLVGEWLESDVDVYTKGRVPDGTMMLNSTTRACIDKMERLEGFSWELNSKPMLVIYQGLSLRPKLTSLTIRFPSNRTPRPTSIIPPIPSLRRFKALSVDPLCYPDDMSWLFAFSPNLSNVIIQWSQRMRDEGELSVNLHSLFSKAMSSQTKLRWKHLGLINLFAPVLPDLEDAFDAEVLESLEVTNGVGNDTDAIKANYPSTAFVDASWEANDRTVSVPRNLKRVKINAPDFRLPRVLSRFSGLEELYIVTGWRPPSDGAQASTSPTPKSSTGTGDTTSQPTTSPNNPFTPLPPSSTASPSREMLTLASDYLAALTQHHSASLRCLLLTPLWSLNTDVLSGLVRACPNLEQLGIAVQGFDDSVMLSQATGLTRLRALRILYDRRHPTWDVMSALDPAQHAVLLGIGLGQAGYRELKWFGLASQSFKVGGVVEAEPGRRNGTTRRYMQPVSWEEAAKEVEIWRMDNLDV